MTYRCYPEETPPGAFTGFWLLPRVPEHIRCQFRASTADLGYAPDMKDANDHLVGGRFELLERLDRGGLAQVYRAFDHQERKLVALKTLDPRGRAGSNEDLDQTRERFRREIAILGRLAACPQVVDLVAADAEAPLPWFAMDYVSGSSLRVLIDEAPEGLITKRYLPIARALVAGLAAIHAERIVHRDLAPDNVVVTKAPDGGVALKLLDFGIGKPLGDEGEPVTRMSTIMGKPAYLSPEQTRSAAVDERSDVYALGVILYEMLVGQRPIEVAGFAEIARVRREEPRPLAAHPGSSRVPEELRALIMRCLAKEAADRPALGELAEVLGEVERRLESGEALSAAFTEWELSRLRDGGGEARGLLAPRERFAGLRAEWLLGGGADHEVWLASEDGREVALQLVRGPAAAGFLDAMTRQQDLDHANILRVEACGIEAEIAWARLELVRGSSLARVLLEEGRMAAGRILQIGQGLLDALVAAGRHHGRLRPSSVLLDEFDTVKLTDFGFGRGPEELDPIVSKGTNAAWSAPERFRGRPVSGPAEVYAVGCLLHAMITGEPPFEGPDLAQAYQHMTLCPLRLRDRLPDFEPRKLLKVVDRALAKNPAERWASVAQLRSAFQAAFSEARSEESGDLAAFPESPPPESPRSWFRRLLGTKGGPED
ncbi:MAG: serine/threonine protein kinase [Planctomycetes bacterium]|nr:serine/threonine protein kinase [Planctomycetota bacterium]